MNKEKILGFVRHVLTAVGALLISKGVIDAAGLESVVGAVLTLAGFAWSWISPTKTTPPAPPAA